MRAVRRLCDGALSLAGWGYLLMTAIIGFDVLARRLLGFSSEATGELTGYLLAAGMTLGLAGTLLDRAHVRIDVLSSRFSKRTQVWIEVFGLLFFLLPLVAVVIVLSWPLVVGAFVSGEVSSNAGGLVRWPVMALLPLGFGLLGLQGLSELIKCVGYLRGVLPEPSGIRGKGSSAAKAKP